MKPLQIPFQIGSLKLPNNIFCAPLAGCSDYPFRKMSAQYGPGLMYCEMVKMEALIRNDRNTFHLLDYDEEMHLIGGQLCGSKPEIAGKAARIIEDLGFDVVDLNCGCPVDKITKDGSGSGMLKNPELIGDVLVNMVAAVKIPVTVKIRAGWDEEHICAETITKIAEKAGAKAITIHGRTREQGYRGKANRDYIKACKEVASHIKVIGNGDIFDAQSAEEMFSQTGCDAILISRGTMGRPWIVEDILQQLRGASPKHRSVEQCREGLMEHFSHIVSYRPEKKAMMDMRRVGCWYFQEIAGAKEFRQAIGKAQSLEDIHDLILHFPFEEVAVQPIAS